MVAVALVAVALVVVALVVVELGVTVAMVVAMVATHRPTAGKVSQVQLFLVGEVAIVAAVCPYHTAAGKVVGVAVAVAVA